MAHIAKKFPTLQYFTYYLHFPDGEVWIDQVPFVHDLQFELNRATFTKNPDVIRDLLQKKETHWVDHNGVTWRIVIEKTKRRKRWGTKTKFGGVTRV